MEALARGAGPEVRSLFFHALLRSQLVVPSPGLDPRLVHSNNPAKNEAAKINIVGTDAPDGSRGMIVFTGRASLLAWRSVGCPYVLMPALDVFGMALGSHLGSVVFNPAGPIGGFVSRSELLALAEGRVPVPLGSSQPVQSASLQLQRPDREIPIAIKTQIDIVAPKILGVRAIWILTLRIEKGEPHLCIVIEHRPDVDPGTFVPMLMKRIQAILPSGQYLDCLPLASGADLLVKAKALSLPVFFSQNQ